MPNFINIFGRYFQLSDDPNLALQEQTAIIANCNINSTDAQIISQIQGVDSTIAPAGTSQSTSDGGGGTDGGNTDEGIVLG